MKRPHSWKKLVATLVKGIGRPRVSSPSRIRLSTFESLEMREVMSGMGTSAPLPSLSINDGMEMTNVRSVEISLDGVRNDAQSMRFAFNGFDYGDWKPFKPSTNVEIPSFRGVNYVNAEILFGDGSKRTVYDSIVYKDPAIVINDAATQTNTQSVTLTFGDVAPDAVGVELAYNGFAYRSPIEFADTMTVALPNYEGTNYVNARIIYPNGKTRFAWDSIEYRRADLRINTGDTWTESREVTLSFESVTPDAETVSLAFNGMNYQKAVAFDSTMTVTLPNWEGANYVNTKIHYADGRELWLWDSIEYVPTVVQACSSCITFALDVQDERGEGFYDLQAGDDRVKAFMHALEIWSSRLKSSYAGERITVEASMDSIPQTDDDKTVLGGARPNRFSMVNGLAHGDALANHKRGQDIHSSSEIWARFNSDATWYYGIDSQANGRNDFVSTVLHEIGHGLNFYGTILDDGAWNVSANGQAVPGIYDSFLVDQSGTLLTTMSNVQRVTAITSGALYWNGTNATAANAAQRPQIYAPTTYESGSSVSHLDESKFEMELMSPEQSGPDHSPSALELGMLKDMGWTLV